MLGGQQLEKDELIAVQKHILNLCIFYLSNLKGGIHIDLAETIITSIGKQTQLDAVSIASSIDEYESNYYENLKKKSI